MSYPFTLFSSREAIDGIVVLMHHRRRSASVATATTSTSFAPEEDEDVKPIIRKPKPRKRYVSTCADSLEMLMSLVGARTAWRAVQPRQSSLSDRRRRERERHQRSEFSFQVGRERG